jgi:hypothetical protein
VNRTLRHLLIALALLFGQQAAQSHALSHLAEHQSRGAGGEKSVPPAGHPAAQCLMFHAVDSALPTLLAVFEPVRAAPPVPAHVMLPLPFPPRIEFDSRAPPVRS